jgi:hypothetical protein
MMIPQMVIMGWINFFFQGFVLSKSNFTTWFSNSAVCGRTNEAKSLVLVTHVFLRQAKLNLFVYHSQAAVPADARIQVNASTRDRDTWYGC